MRCLQCIFGDRIINRECYGIILIQEDDLNESLQNVVVLISSTKTVCEKNVLFIGTTHICVPKRTISSTTSKFGE